ncbi:MAG TPA: hypothetical protein VEX15_16070 [Nocardioidaceae bacterium]|nr:hypothetical protein [Nocardioidaceae bacterium]
MIDRGAGAEADRRRVRILTAAGPRWFDEGSPHLRAASDPEWAVARIRAVHGRVRGIAPDGRQFAASDPRLLT